MKTISKNKQGLRGLLSGLLLAAGSFNAQAVVTVSDFGATAPVLNPSTDTGYTPVVLNNEFPTDGALTFGQSFKTPTTGIVNKVYFNYRSFGLGDIDGLIDFTFRLDVNNDGSYEIDQQFTGVDRNNFVTIPASSWIEFDLLAESITLAAGTTHAIWWNSNNPVGQQVATVRYDNTPLANYADGQSLGNVIGGGGKDSWFAVTTVPEPTSALLLLGSGAMLLHRRRRASA